ncbi:hypothetical protein KDV34_11545 [Citrobacter portucalensis]|uniref:hypothetical protein n=1 Tax=Citrobacter portucalensis TaxID=1639133 RepID=UPI0033384C35
MPDAANALSGLQRHAVVGLISTAHQAAQRTKPDAANALSGLQRHAAVGLISAAHQAAQRTKPDAANALSGLQTTRCRRPDKRSASGNSAHHAGCGLRRHAAVGLISVAHQAVQRTKPDAAYEDTLP